MCERFVLLGDASVIDQQVTNATGSAKAVDNTGNDGKQIESQSASFQASSRDQSGSERTLGAAAGWRRLRRADEIHLIHLSARSISEFLRFIDDFRFDFLACGSVEVFFIILQTVVVIVVVQVDIVQVCSIRFGSLVCF